MKGWQGGLITTMVVFLPEFLLIFGALPFCDRLRNNPKIKGVRTGVNAAVVGILISTLYSPIWMNSILTLIGFVLAFILFSMLVYWKLPPWIIVLTGAIDGLLITFI